MNHCQEMLVFVPIVAIKPHFLRASFCHLTTKYHMNPNFKKAMTKDFPSYKSTKIVCLYKLFMV